MSSNPKIAEVKGLMSSVLKRSLKFDRDLLFAVGVTDDNLTGKIDQARAIHISLHRGGEVNNYGQYPQRLHPARRFVDPSIHDPNRIACGVTGKSWDLGWDCFGALYPEQMNIYDLTRRDDYFLSSYTEVGLGLFPLALSDQLGQFSHGRGMVMEIDNILGIKTLVMGYVQVGPTFVPVYAAQPMSENHCLTPSSLEFLSLLVDDQHLYYQTASPNQPINSKDHPFQVALYKPFPVVGLWSNKKIPVFASMHHAAVRPADVDVPHRKSGVTYLGVEIDYEKTLTMKNKLDGVCKSKAIESLVSMCNYGFGPDTNLEQLSPEVKLRRFTWKKKGDSDYDELDHMGEILPPAKNNHTTAKGPHATRAAAHIVNTSQRVGSKDTGESGLIAIYQIDKPLSPPRTVSNFREAGIIGWELYQSGEFQTDCENAENLGDHMRNHSRNHPHGVIIGTYPNEPNSRRLLLVRVSHLKLDVPSTNKHRRLDFEGGNFMELLPLPITEGICYKVLRHMTLNALNTLDGQEIDLIQGMDPETKLCYDLFPGRVQEALRIWTIPRLVEEHAQTLLYIQKRFGGSLASYHAFLDQYLGDSTELLSSSASATASSSSAAASAPDTASSSSSSREVGDAVPSGSLVPFAMSVPTLGCETVTANNCVVMHTPSDPYSASHGASGNTSTEVNSSSSTSFATASASSSSLNPPTLGLGSAPPTTMTSTSTQTSTPGRGEGDGSCAHIHRLSTDATTSPVFEGASLSANASSALSSTAFTSGLALMSAPGFGFASASNSAFAFSNSSSSGYGKGLGPGGIDNLTSSSASPGPSAMELSTGASSSTGEGVGVEPLGVGQHLASHATILSTTSSTSTASSSSPQLLQLSTLSASVRDSVVVSLPQPINEDANLATQARSLHQNLKIVVTALGSGQDGNNTVVDASSLIACAGQLSYQAEVLATRLAALEPEMESNSHAVVGLAMASAASRKRESAVAREMESAGSLAQTGQALASVSSHKRDSSSLHDVIPPSELDGKASIPSTKRPNIQGSSAEDSKVLLASADITHYDEQTRQRMFDGVLSYLLTLEKPTKEEAFAELYNAAQNIENKIHQEHNAIYQQALHSNSTLSKLIEIVTKN